MNATSGPAEVKVIPIAGQMQTQVKGDEFLAVSDLVPVQGEADNFNIRTGRGPAAHRVQRRQRLSLLVFFGLPVEAPIASRFLDSVHPERVDFGSGQGRSDFATLSSPWSRNTAASWRTAWCSGWSTGV
jgi:hypothetical protein